MDERLNKIEGKIDAINTTLHSIDKTLVRQQASLDEHIRRTNLLEQKLEPVEKHVHMVNGAFKFIGIIAILLGIIASIVKIIA